MQEASEARGARFIYYRSSQGDIISAAHPHLCYDLDRLADG